MRTTGENNVFNISITEGDVLYLKLKVDSEGKRRLCGDEKRANAASAVEPGHIGRDGEWW